MQNLNDRMMKFFKLFGLTLVLYSVARFEFFVWNFDKFKSISFWQIFEAFAVGVRFDLSAVAYLSLIPLLMSYLPWQKCGLSLKKQNFFQWILYVSIQVPLVILSLVDTAYVDFVGRRFTWDTLFLWGEVQGKLWSFLAPFLGLFMVNLVLVGAYLWMAWKVLQRPLLSKDESSTGSLQVRVKKYLLNASVGFLSLVLIIIAARGGLQSKPLNFVNANVFDVPVLNNLVLNSTFTVLKTYGGQKLARTQYFQNPQEMYQELNGATLFQGEHNKASLLLPPIPLAKPVKNVVILILESFGTEYTAAGGEPSYTPFLDQLAKDSLYFSQGMANGRRSIEGVAAIMAGIPALMSEPFVSSSFASNYFLGLGTLLENEGFTTAFFHGGNNGTMYFDTFMKSAGVGAYFGANEYPHKQDHDGVWGIWDEPFLQWSIKEMSDLKAPFMASVFTLSSHQPFQVPEQYKERFPEGPLPILKAVKYADFALQRFMEEAAKQPWFEETLFVITADHTSMHFRESFQNEVGNYRVPILFYQKGQVWPTLDTLQPVSQIDILPSVMHLLGKTSPLVNLLGRSVFIDGERVVVNYIDGRYLIVTKNDWLVWSELQSSTHSQMPKLYSTQDPAGKDPLDNPQRVEALVTKIKAHIQYFSQGMWDNRLYYRVGN